MRGRFAPSPTGDLHLGNARTALLAWLQVRSANGRFVLRVEDLDRGRVRPKYLENQLTDLRWLGLDWDEGPETPGDFGPYLQSHREQRYEQALAELKARGLLYPCSCSRREIAASASAPQGDEDEGPAYPGTCRARPVEERTGEQVALRFRVPEGEVRFVDAVYGERMYRPALETGDFVVQRKDGVAAYQLAVVVDDAAMEITHVLRGADLLSSTARQILLYRALDLPEPSWAHVPLLLAAEGARLSKRAGGLSLRELRESGVPPERVVGWLAESCNLIGPGKECSPRELIANFDLQCVPRDDTSIELPAWAAAKGA